MDVSVGIAAHNEEATISCTIRSLLSQRGVHIVEILVCTNGCTDATEEAVEVLSRQHSEVRGIHLPEPGKPAAWNTVLGQARAPLLVFADADVVVGPYAVHRLAEALEGDPRLIAVAGRPVPIVAGLDPLRRLLARPPFPVGCLIGRLYAVRRAGLLERMHEIGRLQMPPEVIGDDTWVTLAVGRQRWIEVPGAVAYYVPPAPSELLETYRRAYRSDRQLRTLMLERYRRNRERVGHRLRRLVQGLVAPRELASRARAALSFALLWEIRAIARLQTVCEGAEAGSARWKVARATKDGRLLAQAASAESEAGPGQELGR